MTKTDASDGGLLHTIPYNQTKAAKAPIAITTSSAANEALSTRDPQPAIGNHFPSSFSQPSLSQSATSPVTTATNGSFMERDTISEHNLEDKYSDWFQGTESSTRDSQASFATENKAASSRTSDPSVRQKLDQDVTGNTVNKSTTKKWLTLKPKSSDPSLSANKSTFTGLSVNIPTTGLSDDIGTKNMKFSKRGSMFIDGKKVSGATSQTAAMPSIIEPPDTSEKRQPDARKRAASAITDRISARIMSTDEQVLSEKVRTFYFLGSDHASEQDASPTVNRKMSLRWQDALTKDTGSMLTVSRTTSATDTSKQPPSPTIAREDNELAGGLEDWQDIGNEDVDRYGFIIPKSPTGMSDTSTTGIKRTPTTSGPGLQRVSTSLQLAADTPRRRHTVKRSASNAGQHRSSEELHRAVSDQSLRRPTSSRSAHSTRHQSTARMLTNRLPHNKDRRLMDEAADMLTRPRSNTTNTITRAKTEDSNGATAGTYTPTSTPQSKRKEIEREEKWRKMARTASTKTGAVGGGMTFTFDTTSPKLIERTWKGIPDTWRATAWHSFLAASAQRYNKKHPLRPCLDDDQLISMFHEYQDHNCPDDVQIDIDVPRTISSHIMFRRRYRGGQRLLFRVLHAMSMHFVETGYVQGMAALAATFLAYYEEERAFIMLVRLWELRGLEKLYKHGFGGLMEALDDFEKNWLGAGELGKRLESLMIGPTAYGTRWYLTLFNYSIPFPAQLRVWDVFMLLGDDEDNVYEIDSHKTTTAGSQNVPTSVNGIADKTTFSDNKPEKDDGKEDKANFGTTLDILHATSAALIDGMRDILLESDFENAMKVLTSWVPIRDEDLFMRVTRAEWKMHQLKRGTTT